MMMMMGGTSLHRSPKRKRDASETETSSPPASPTSSLSVASSLPEARLIEAEDVGRYSPRTAVTSRFKELAIREPGLKSELGRINTATQMQESADDQAHPLAVATAAVADHPQSPPASDSYKHQSGATCDNNSTQETADEHALGTNHPSSRAKQHETKPPRKKAKSVSASAKPRRKSPPPAETDSPNPLTWSDSEITGHNPTDPNDDGYGINGVGFKPTPAIAWARSRQRQKQVAEWRHREAKEARERRRERREGVIQDKKPDDGAEMVQKKVKFDLG